MSNIEIRSMIKKEGFRYYEVADQMGVCDSAFSRLLRKELSEEKKILVIQAINELKEKRNGI